ncbi:MAG: thermonuclease family protein [Beijerinckiaceae bacterium]|nr:thermonuclease family protein [Beijerinckiaceae bacterium]
MANKTIDAEVERPVDGDTVRVLIDGKSEAVRIQGLDTEESKQGGDKPQTPWGKEAAAHAASIFVPGKTISLDFDVAGDSEANLDLSRFRDNFGRLLALVVVDGMDFQEHMIEEGFSPYFVKYGNVRTAEYHQRYLAAERRAQSKRAGLWDQFAVNGSERRNYYVLGTWWALRAAVIEDYRRLREGGSEILNPRVDFERIKVLAEERKRATIFTEFGQYVRLGSRKAIVRIGSMAQPFAIFIPDVESDAGQGLVSLLSGRYIAGGTEGGATVTQPRRSYGYVTGQLALFRGDPEIVAGGPEAISDVPV